jgi:hypothetical protein
LVHKILGIVFDKKLSWDPHVKQTKARALKKINIIKCLANTKWGADQSTLLYIHRGSAKQKVLDKLEPVNNKGIRAAIGAFCITKTAHLLEEADSISISKMRKLSEASVAIKYAENTEHPLYPFTRQQSTTFQNPTQMKMFFPGMKRGSHNIAKNTRILC